MTLHLMVMIVVCLSQNGFSQQAQERGIPMIRNFMRTEYSSQPQNYCAVQDKRGVMYIGNADGILEYDGAYWRLISSPNHFPIFSLGVDANGMIYAGGFGDFFVLQKDSAGQLELRSLMHNIPDEALNFKQVWKIIVRESRVYFVSPEMLFRLDEKGLKYWKPQTQITDCSFRNATLTTNQTDGEYILEDDRLVKNTEAGKNTDRISIRHSNVALASSHSRWALIENASEVFLQDDANTVLQWGQPKSAVMLLNQEIVIGTERWGILHIDRQGRMLSHITRSSGLCADAVTQLYVDLDQRIWVMTFNGVSLVDLLSPATIHGEQTGLHGSVTTITRHQGTLYAGTLEGLFVLTQTTTEAQRHPPLTTYRWKQIPEIGPRVWKLLSTGTHLLALSDGGIVQSYAGRWSMIPNTSQDLQCIIQSRRDPRICYVGTARGIFALEQQQSRWRRSAFKVQLNTYAMTLAEDHDGALWIGTPNDGPIRVQVEGSGNIPIVSRFHNDKNLPDEDIYVSMTSRGVLFSTAYHGIYRYDKVTDNFYRDRTFERAHGDTGRLNVLPIVEDRKQHLVMFCWIHRQPAIAALQRHTSDFVISEPLTCIPHDDVNAIYCDDEYSVWFGRTADIIQYDRSMPFLHRSTIRTLIRSVRIGKDSVVYWGNTEDSAAFDIPFHSNSVRFEFSGTSFLRQEENEYRFALEGFDSDWSPWTKETRKDYTNLPTGTYKFRVISRDAFGAMGVEATFTIQILSPWYASWWAYLSYLFAAVLFIFAIVRGRTNQLHRHRVELEEKVRERTTQLRLQSDEISRQKEELEKFNDELRQMNEQIVRTQQQLITQEKLASLGSLTAGIAHEIQNPLNFVTNFASLNESMIKEIEADLQSEHEQSRKEQVFSALKTLYGNTRLITEHGERAAGIIHSMLQHSRVRRGERSLEDIHRLLDQSVSLAYHGMRSAEKTYNVRIVKNYQPNLPPIVIMPEEMSRVFLNLVNNAFYSVQEKRRNRNEQFIPEVTISTAADDGTHTIRIRDNGSGIPESVRDQIFKPFFSTKPTGAGTGLGLSISYDIIVQLHGGSISFDSVEGEFTEFIIRLKSGT